MSASAPYPGPAALAPTPNADPPTPQTAAPTPQTAAPTHADASQWIARDEKVVWHGFTQMAAFAGSAPVVVERAEARELIDVEGRRYLDAISSLWVTTLGHRHQDLDQALTAQLAKVAHSTMLGSSNTAVVELAEALARVVPVSDPHFLFASDGASAVEQALKIAFQYWVNKGVRGRSAYLALGDAYHGDTVGSLSLGAGGFGTDIFDPLRFPVLRTPGYADPGWLEKATAALEENRSVLAAVVVEPLVQGAAGMLVADPSEVRALGEACRRAGVLLVADEVATGFGRTGRLFASEWCGLEPDVMCLGKGLTGGYLPMSATVASRQVYDAFLGEDLGPQAFYHGHSYGGNALGAAVALAHLGVIERDGVLDNVLARGEQLGKLAGERFGQGRIAGLVKQVRRRGLMMGVELDPLPGAERFAKRVCAAATRRGVLLRPLGDVVVVMPPLTVSAAEIERIVDTLADALAETASETAAKTASETASETAGRASPESRPVRSSPEVSPGEERPYRAERYPVTERSWRAEADLRCAEIEASGRWRAPKVFDALGPAGVLTLAPGPPETRAVVAFASNDYLGLSAHRDVVAAAHQALDRFGTGAGASRLVTGTRPLHVELECEIASWKHTERAAVFPTGFAANLGVLGALGGRDVLVCSDALNHASIVDGSRLSRSQVAVYRHGDVAHAAELLASWPGLKVIVSDLVFSMDGDMAPVGELAELAARTGALLVLDEAHAVMAPDCRPELHGPELHGPESAGPDVLYVGTLSKTLGSLGGFVAGSRRLVELIENSARSYIFTTALTPADAAAALAALRVLRSEEGASLVARLAGHVASVHRAVGAGGEMPVSPIVPVVLGSEERALAASADLLDQGIWVPAIRPPSVPEGTSRLRVTLSAAHSDVQVQMLCAALARLVGS